MSAECAAIRLPLRQFRLFDLETLRLRHVAGSVIVIHARHVTLFVVSQLEGVATAVVVANRFDHQRTQLFEYLWILFDNEVFNRSFLVRVVCDGVVSVGK